MGIFPCIGHAVDIGISNMRIGAQCVFLKIGQAITIRIKRGVVHQRIQTVCNFPAVGHAIPVGIGDLRIRTPSVFLKIGQAVKIRIKRRIIHQRIQAVGIFPHIGHAVAVGVQSPATTADPLVTAHIHLLRKCCRASIAVQVVGWGQRKGSAVVTRRIG